MRYIRDIFAAAFLAGAVTPAAMQAEDAGAMALALAGADAGDWVTARDAASRSGPLAEALVGWQALRAGFGDFDTCLGFIRSYGDWPGLALLRQRCDARVGPGLDGDAVREWFGDRRPATLGAELAFLSGLPDDAAQAERARFWTQEPLSAAEEQGFIDRFGAEAAALNAQRVTTLLDAQEWAAAERALNRLPAEQRALPAARVALQARRVGVDTLIEAVPADQRADPGLTLDRFIWRVNAKRHDDARALMIEASTSADALRVPDLWAQMRVDYARLAMRDGDWPLAEQLASAHFLTPDNRHYPDLEWLAGYAALRQGAADRALGHFQHLETVVGSAISNARALYWQGRALDMAGQADQAQVAFRAAAAQPGTYYGQLAAERLGLSLPAEYSVTGQALAELPDWRGSDLRDNQVFRAGLWLLATGRVDEAQRFFLHLAETAAPDDIARMARLMIEARHPWHALRLSKQAASKGAVYPAAHFPLTGLEGVDLGLPPELVMAIARQESEFNHTVSSHVGAQGLMQLMPDTARQMASRVGEAYDPARLTRDPAYNARLGAAYLDGLRGRFGPSVALVAAGYNAGPGRSDRWLEQFGDLRRETDPVDWVELIPFDETRNYVMRVAEALPVYRSRIAGTPAPLVPSWDLSGGGLMPAPRYRLRVAFSDPPPRKPVIEPDGAGETADTVSPAAAPADASATR